MTKWTTWTAVLATVATLGSARVARADDGGADDGGAAADGSEPTDGGATDGSATDGGDGGALGQLGEPCTEASGCASGFCTDGVCCNSGCGGQCQACNGASTAGTCVPVVGAPHGSRAPCSSGGSPNPCADTLCDGITVETCAGFVGATVTCGAATCVNGEATQPGVCNGQGSCTPPNPVQCGAYACGTSACVTKCASASDCASGFVCDTTNGVCGSLATGECNPDGHTVTEPDGTTTDCTPYVCNADGLCLLACVSNADCVTGDVCNASQECVLASTAAASAAGSSSGGGCAAAPASENGAVGWVGLALAGVLAGARRKRGRR